MSASSNNQGRAYEYAWICVLEEGLEEYRHVDVVNNSSLEANKRAWDSMPAEKQESFYISAKSAVYQLIDLEPLLAEKSEDALTLEFQSDKAGKQGDVRDIIIRRDSLDWEIGLSIKHNHDAVKHSRLSSKLDFGKTWYGVECSEEYWKTVTPLFNWLKEENSIGTKWSNIKDKDTRVYIPLLKAFMKEINRAYGVDKNIPKKMIEYLIGKYDYHKLISYDTKSMTLVRSYNLHNTLGLNVEDCEVRSLPSIKLPTSLLNLRFKEKSSNTVEMTFNNGWKLKFRIHNASSLVEPSLKFDIQFISMPDSVVTYECVWIK